MNTTHQRPDDSRAERAPDLTPSEFREALEQVADWVARYREDVRSFPVASRVEPGDVRARLPAPPPAKPQPPHRREHCPRSGG